MKQSLYFGNKHPSTQQQKMTQKVFIQKRSWLVKKGLSQFRNFMKEALEKNGDFFLNNNDF